MTPFSGTNLSVALIHHPVLNRNGDVVASAVTNLDLHDIARAAKTYGVRAVYIVTPLEDQKQLTRRIVDYWMTGGGAGYNPSRREAVALIRLADSLGDAMTDLEMRIGVRPKTVATSAQKRSESISCRRVKAFLDAGTPCLLLLGTAWGLAEEIFEWVDFTLDPIRGKTDYNHLSVRSAAAIFFDRLLGST